MHDSPCTVHACPMASHFNLQMLGLRKRWNEDTTEAALRPRTFSAMSTVTPGDAAIIAALQKELEELKSQMNQTKSAEVRTYVRMSHDCHVTLTRLSHDSHVTCVM